MSSSNYKVLFVGETSPRSVLLILFCLFQNISFPQKVFVESRFFQTRLRWDLMGIHRIVCACVCQALWEFCELIVLCLVVFAHDFHTHMLTYTPPPQSRVRKHISNKPAVSMFIFIKTEKIFSLGAFTKSPWATASRQCLIKRHFSKAQLKTAGYTRWPLFYAFNNS